MIEHGSNIKKKCFRNDKLYLVLLVIYMSVVKKTCFMSRKLYLALLGIYILIVVVNYNSLKNPKPYPPEEMREELKSGTVTLSSWKYVGLSHYIVSRVAQSESNWVNGNTYWFKSCVNLGIIGIVVTLMAMILGEVFRLYDYFIGICIPLISSALGMIVICYRMEKKILKD